MLTVLIGLIQHWSALLFISPPSPSDNFLNYIKQKAVYLKDFEKDVILLMDEIHLTHIVPSIEKNNFFI